MEHTSNITPLVAHSVDGNRASTQVSGRSHMQAKGSSPFPTARSGFSQVLAATQDNTAASSALRMQPPPPSRWSSLNFLTTAHAPRVRWPWTRTHLSQLLNTAASNLNPLATFVVPQTATPAPQPTVPTIKTAAVAAATLPSQPMALSDYPRPRADNGRGIHWIPTISQSPEVIDKYVAQAVEMGMKWVVFLNEGTDIGKNDYLVQKLTSAGIEPVMRVYTPGVVPIEGDLKAMVKHYTQMGVRYFQLYNEPNLRVETGGKPADVDQYVNLWSSAAQQVIEAGGLPGFGALSPQGEMDDRAFLQQALARLKELGKTNLLNRGWLAMHNYTGPRPLNDPDGFLRFKQYNAIIEQALGRSLPIIGTEGGTHVTAQVSPEKQIQMVTGAYKYMAHREPYNFVYTYWIIANGHDPAWDSQALFKPNGPTPLAQALKDMASGGNV